MNLEKVIKISKKIAKKYFDPITVYELTEKRL